MKKSKCVNFSDIDFTLIDKVNDFDEDDCKPVKIHGRIRELTDPFFKEQPDGTKKYQARATLADDEGGMNEELTFNPVIYDPNGFYFDSEPIFTVFNLNYITEFYMRNPANIYKYLEYLNDYTEEILGNRKVAKFYERFDCEQVKRNNN